MIAEGRRLAASSGRRNINWLRCRAEDISTGAGPFRVATIGQAFHWMDRDEVLRTLAIVIADGGGLALVGPAVSVQNADVGLFGALALRVSRYRHGRQLQQRSKI